MRLVSVDDRLNSFEDLPIPFTPVQQMFSISLLMHMQMPHHAFEYSTEQE
jgi:hypothetical protein